MTAAQLNQEFGIADQLQIVEGKSLFPMIEITNEQASARISVYGGQVLSFKPAGESSDLLFVSEKAYYQPGKAIKGGTPVCWPWFGPDPEGKGRASHGFVRNRMWTLLSTEAVSAGETKVRLGVSANEETKAIWPYSFELVIEIVVADQLSISLITQNTGDKAFEITQALHTYFQTGDIGKVEVLGLENAGYIDKVDNGAEKTQTGIINITQEVDRIYTNVKPELSVQDGGLGRRIRISSAGSRTAVVWNPWTDISIKSGDLTDDAYQEFVCVETVNAADDMIGVAPGSEYTLKAVYAIEKG
ncbi:MAG: D-hexose-6-phosphate mutarotase [Cyanobacteria bacterium J06634_6]